MTNGMFTPPDGEDEKHAYHTKLEKKLKRKLASFDNFVESQILSGFLLFIATAIALIWASHPVWQSAYHTLVKTSFGFQLEEFIFSKTLQFWANDVLLTLFFFVVGLEIKRELLVGELVDRKRALTVIAAAVGGMIFPAIIFTLFNYDQPTLRGWGIPVATDTAFALGILSCFRKQCPKGLFTFLAALAIIDDIGAICIIGFFYSDNVDIAILSLAFALICFLTLLNYAGVRKLTPYFIFGLLIWLCVELAEIHGTVAGIVVAFTIPARPAKGPRTFIKQTKELILFFEKRKEENPLILEDQKQHEILEEVKHTVNQATTPLQRSESALERHIGFFILPIFALLNAGIAVNLSLISEIFYHPLSKGIFFGLLIGKPLGIMLFTLASLKMKIGSLPDNINLRHIAFVGVLGGMGFTMSIFMTTLGFQDKELVLLSKAAIILASITAATAVIIGLSLSSRNIKST